MMIEAGLIASRFLHYAALLVLFGGTLFPLYAFPTSSMRPDWFMARQRRAETFAAVLALVSGLAWLAFTTAEMSGVASDALSPSAVWDVVKETGFGRLWVGRLGLMAAIVSTIVARTSWALWVSPFLAGALLVSLAGAGHGSAPEGPLGALHAVSDGFHLLAAGLWLGALAPLSWTMRAALYEKLAQRGFEVEIVLQRFSGVGYLAVAILIGTGLVNSWFLVGSLRMLTENPYGRLLAIKLGLFVAMMAFASANRFWIAPTLVRTGSADHGPGLRRIRNHIAFEQALGLAVIGAVSVLGTMQPAIQN